LDHQQGPHAWEHRLVDRHSELTNFIWAIADLLRHDYKPSECGRVILPLTVLRRLDCVLEPTKDKVRSEYERYKDRIENLDPLLRAAAGQTFYNTSRYDFESMLADPATIADALRSYIAGFSPKARDIIDRFGFHTQITRLDDANLLYLVLPRVSSFTDQAALRGLPS